MNSFIAFGVQSLAKSVTTRLRHAWIIALVAPSLVAAVTVTQVNDRAKIIANSSGTCIRSSTATTTSCSSSLGGNILAYLPAGQTRTGTVQSITPSGGFNWFNVNWDSANPVASGYVRTDVVQLDVPLCSWSQSPPSTATVGVAFSVSLSCYGNPTQYAWDFFNGSTTFNTQNPFSITYSSALGTANARAFAVNAAGNGNQLTALVNVVAAGTPPTCSPTTNSASTPVGSAVTLTSNCSSNAGNISYQWTATNGGPAGSSPTSSSNTVTPATAGTWSYSLLVSNSAGSNTYANFYSVQATAAGTPPACTPVAFPTSIPAGNGAQLESNCAPNPSGGTIYSTWSAPVTAGAPTLSNTSETYATTVNVANANTVGSFTYSLMARNFYGTSGPFYVTLQVTQPVSNGITLTTPVNNATGVSTTPSFSWTSVSAPSGYSLSIEPADGVGVAPAFSTPTNSFTWPSATGALQTNKQYKWRVTTDSGVRWSPYSYFTTTNVLPPGTVFLAPSIFNFGEVAIGSCASSYIIVQSNINTGLATGSVSVSAPFSLPSGGGFTANNSTAQVLVKVCPTTQGATSTTVTGTAGVVTGPTMTLTATGVSASTPSSLPAQLVIDKIGRQLTNSAFRVNIRATNATVATSIVQLSVGGGIPVRPSRVTLAGGVWSGDISVLRPGDNLRLQATSGSVTGTSNPFMVEDPKLQTFDPATQTPTRSQSTPITGRLVDANGLAVTSQTHTAHLFYENPDGSLTFAGSTPVTVTGTYSFPPALTRIGKHIVKIGVSSVSATVIQAKVIGREIVVTGQKAVAVVSDFVLGRLIDAGVTCGSKAPVVLVPGMMGSTTGDGDPFTYNAAKMDGRLGGVEPSSLEILDQGVSEFFGAGSRLFGRAVDTREFGFDALKEHLQSAQYQVYEAPYDWRLTVDRAAGQYLKYWIELAKSKCGVQKVNVVTHSMGGLVARAYIQGFAKNVSGADVPYGNDIEKLIMVGTPNNGSANPYWMVEGGAPQDVDDAYYEVTKRNMPSHERCLAVQMATASVPKAEAKCTREYYRNDVPGALNLMATNSSAYSSSTLAAGTGANASLVSQFNAFDYSLARGHSFGISKLNNPDTSGNNLSRLIRFDQLAGAQQVKTALFLSNGVQTIRKIEVGAPGAIVRDGRLYEHGEPKRTGRYLLESFAATIPDGNASSTFAGDGTVPTELAMMPFVSLPVSPACLSLGCITDAASGARISIRVANWTHEHMQLMGELKNCISAALDNSDNNVNNALNCDGLKRSTASKALAATPTTPQLSIRLSGDIDANLTSPTGQVMGIDDTQNLRVDTAGALVRNTNGQGYFLQPNATDGTYALNIRSNYDQVVELVTTFRAPGADVIPIENRSLLHVGDTYSASAAATSVSLAVAGNSMNHLIVTNGAAVAPTVMPDYIAGTVRLTWNSTGAVSYRVYRRTEQSGVWEQVAAPSAPAISLPDAWHTNADELAAVYAVSSVDANGKESVFSNLVGSRRATVAAFDISALQGLAPLTVNFTDRSVNGATAWSWDFDGDGLADSALPSPSYTYTQPGTYLVRLKVDGANGSSEATARQYITVISADDPSVPGTHMNAARASAGAVAAASSTASAGYAPANAINGDRIGLNWGGGGGWEDGTPYTHADWLQIDFNAAKSIERVDIFLLQDNYPSPVAPSFAQTFNAYGLVDFDLEYWDGSRWQLVPGGAIRGNNLVRRVVTFAAISTSKIRVVSLASKDAKSRIVEIEAWEKIGDTTPPTTPTTLTATSPTTSTAALNWGASTDSGGSGLAGYKVERCAGSGCSNFAQSSTPTTNSFGDAGLTASTIYSYRVRAYDNANNFSGYSNTATVTTLGGTVNGVCGSASGGSFTSAPVLNLCASGTATAVNGAGPWAWSCAGTGGGTTAQCSASIIGTVPNAFAFAPKTNVAVNTPVTSDPVTISGITVPVNVSVTNGEYSIGCSGVFVTAPGTVVNNQTLCVRHVSAALNGTNRSSLLDVGGVRAAFSSVTLAAGGCTVQPSPGKDTYYGNVYLTTGMPTAEWIHVGGWGDMYRSYVQIDVSSLPAAANTVSAELQLYITNASVADPLLRMYRIDSAWTDVGVTIAAQPSVTYLNEGPRNATTGTWYRLDITNLYREWKNGTRSNFGVMLEPGYMVNSAYTFASSEAPTASQRPKIVVQSNNGACSIPAMTCDLNIAGRSVGDDQLDGTMLLRYLLGFRGAALTAGLTLSGTRKAYQEVEQFLSLFNYDADGSGKADPTVDGLILLRLLRGASDAELLNGVVLPANATVRDAASMRARAQACMASMVN